MTFTLDNIVYYCANTGLSFGCEWKDNGFVISMGDFNWHVSELSEQQLLNAYIELRILNGVERATQGVLTGRSNE